MKPNIARQTSHEHKSDYSSEGASWSFIQTTPHHFHSRNPPAPPSPSASLESTSQNYLPTSAWMMSNRVGEWGHYRHVEVWIGAPEASFVSHSQLPLTLKCAAHLTRGGETGVSAHFRFVFLKLKQADLFREGPQQYFPKCWMEAVWESAVKCLCVCVCVEMCCPHCFSLQACERKRKGREMSVLCALAVCMGVCQRTAV